MATLSELLGVLVALSGLPEARIRQYLRQLQVDGLLPVASGRRVPQLSAKDAAMIVIGLAFGETVATIGENTRTWSDLVCVNRGKSTFGDDLAALLDDPASAAKITFVQICKSVPASIIAIEVGNSGETTEVDEWKYLPADEISKPIGLRKGPGNYRTDVTIDGGFLHQLSFKLKTGDRLLAG